MANRNFANSRIYTGHVMPVLLDCNFVVDPSNANGLGISSLKGPYIKNVYMNVSAPPSGSPPLLSSSTYTAIGASTLTNTGATTLNGNLALSPGTSVTGFPPGVITGAENIANAAAAQAKADAQASYTYLQSLPAGTAAGALGGLTLSPGTYTSATTMSLTGTLTLDAGGNPNAVWVFQMGTTLTTAAASIITIINGGSASNVYWQVGSSATLGTTTAFKGTIIAQVSVTANTGATIQGRLFALTGAVTLDTNTITIPTATSSVSPAAGNPNPSPGTIVVQMQDNYSRSYSGFHQIISPISGTPIAVTSGAAALTIGRAYIITTLGTTTTAQWHTLGVPAGLTPAVGMSFIAATTGTGAGTGFVETTASLGSGISSIELVGNPNLSIAPLASSGQSYGAVFVLQTRDFTGTIAAPAAGSTISLAFYLSNSSVLIQGE